MVIIYLHGSNSFGNMQRMRRESNSPRRWPRIGALVMFC